MKKGITIKDIAKKLNMSISTVSKALNNDVTISFLTKERVHEAAKKMHYVPNEAARNFKQSKTFTIGLIIPNLLDQFFVLAINGVEVVSEKQKYNVILSQSHEEVAIEEKIMNVMIRNRVEGIIVAITKNTVDMQLFHNLESMGIPVVFIAREPPSPEFNYVVTANQDGSFNATEFLITKGHTRIAHLMGPASLQTSLVRLQGYKNALLAHNLPFDDALVKEVDFTPESAGAAMQQLMALPNPPTAIFVFKTYIALDAIEYLKINYPERLGTIDFLGFGNLPLLQYLYHKPVASIEENSYEMGVKAAELLIRIINQPDTVFSEPEHMEIGCSLLVH